MKILFVLPEYLPRVGGGIITAFSVLLPWLARAGHEVKVIYGSSFVNTPGGGKSTIDGIEIEVLDSDLFSKYIPRFGRYETVPKLQRHLAAAWALWEQAQRNPSPDVVQVTDWGLLFLPWMLRKGPPMVTSLHGSVGQVATHDPFEGDRAADALIQLIEVLGLSSVDAVLSNSTNNVRFWTDKLGRKVDLIRSVFVPRNLPQNPGERTERGLVIGRVQRWKGPHVLSEAIRLLGQGAPDIDWVGRDMPIDKSNGSTARCLAQTWPDVWGRKIHHLPEESPARIHERQLTAGFVVVPSTWDVFNFTCIEAMACAAPVICSSGAGASDLIENGVTGYVYESTDGPGLAENIERLVSMGSQRRREIGNAGAEAIKRALAPETVLPARLDLYHALIRGDRKPRPIDEDLISICSPSEEASSLDASLNEIALRHLLVHSAHRVLRKFGLGRS
jgi:glycosyltransferase involved in cell wall biosynthesis